MQQRRVFSKDDLIPGNLVKINYGCLRNRHSERKRERERERENIPPTALATFDFLKYIRTTVPFRQEKHALLITGWRDLVWTART